MRTASISTLKSKLSEFLRLVKEGGDTIMIMDRGRPVALLSPYGAEAEVEAAGSEMAELRDAGLVRVGSGKLPADFWRRPLPPDPDGTVRAALLEDREEGW